jgi:hypothetical protein
MRPCDNWSAQTLSRVGRALAGAGGGKVSGASRAGLWIGKGDLGDCHGHEQKTVRWLHVFWQVSHCHLSMIRNEAKATGSVMTRLPGQLCLWVDAHSPSLTSFSFELVFRYGALLCVTRTPVPYIASTTLVHRIIVNSSALSFCPYSSLSKHSDQTSLTA